MLFQSASNLCRILKIFTLYFYRLGSYNMANYYYNINIVTIGYRVFQDGYK